MNEINKAKVTKLDVVNLAIHMRQNGLIFNGFKVKTFMFSIGILKILEEISALYGVKFEVKTSRWNAPIKKWLVKTLKTEKGRKFFEKYIQIPSSFYPKHYKDLDGHKITMWGGEKNIATRHILDDYITLDVWEEETTKIIKENVGPDDVCLDVGASIGPITLLLCRQAKHVIAVEPTERCFNYLCQNLEANGYTNCTPLKMAGWDKNEIVRMPMNDPDAIYVNGICLDDWLETNGHEKIDFIKIDVDGPEPKVLRGLERTIERNPNLKMVIEFYPKYIAGAGCNPGEFLEIINKWFDYQIIPGDYEGDCWNLFCKRKNI